MEIFRPNQIQRETAKNGVPVRHLSRSPGVNNKPSRLAQVQPERPANAFMLHPHHYGHSTRNTSEFCATIYLIVNNTRAPLRVPIDLSLQTEIAWSRLYGTVQSGTVGPAFYDTRSPFLTPLSR